MTLRFFFAIIGILTLAGCSPGPRLAGTSDLAITEGSKKQDEKPRTEKLIPLDQTTGNFTSTDQRVRIQATRSTVSPILDLGSLHGLILGARITRKSDDPDGALPSQLSTGGSVSLSTWGLHGFVEYETRRAVGALDAAVHLAGQTSRRKRRIYGLGNETPFLETNVAGLGFPRIELEPSVGMLLTDDFSWRAGGTLRYVDLGSPDSVDLAPAQNALPAEDFAPHSHAGGFLSLRLDEITGGAFPIQGFQIKGRGDVRTALVDSAGTYAGLGGYGALYLPISMRQPIVLALRIGGEHRFGDFPIYDAATVGGNSMRRYYGNRFAGRTAVYGNAELRLRLATLEMLPIPMDLGVLAFADVGRVWIDNEASNTWHAGGGGGFWLGLMHEFVGQGMLYATENGLGLTAGLGFHF